MGGGDSSPDPEGIIRYGVRIIPDLFDGDLTNNYEASAYVFIDGKILNANVSVNGIKVPVDGNT